MYGVIEVFLYFNTISLYLVEVNVFSSRSQMTPTFVNTSKFHDFPFIWRFYGPDIKTFISI